MILLNFSHPITDSQCSEIERLTDEELVEIIDIKVNMNQDISFVDQVRELVDSIDLTPKDWQSLPILINPPSYNFAAIILLAELHGRMGYFPSIIRIRPVPESTPPRYEVAEIINLQEVREMSRQLR